MNLYIGSKALKNAYIGEYKEQYQEVEYISSSSVGPTIDTGHAPTNNTVVQLKFNPLGVTGGAFIGTKDQSDSADWRLFNYTSKVYFDCYSARISGGSLAANNIYELECGNNYVKNVGASGNIISGSTLGSFKCGSNLFLYNSEINITRYYVKIYESGTLVRNMIPVYRRNDGKIGMLDTVNNVFYTNTGTGTFTKGADVN